MIGNTTGPMEVLVQQISEGQCNKYKTAVKKVYIDEDPSKEEIVPCPNCSQRNLHRMVRYLYLNLNEAILKCEASDCMYPFRNFKFKNYDDNTVYQYQQQPIQTASKLALENLHTNHFLKECNTYEPLDEHIASVDFDLDFLSCGSAPQKHSALADISTNHIQELQHCESLSRSFDTRFIDDILQDLLPSSTAHVADTIQPTKESTLPPEASRSVSEIKMIEGIQVAQTHSTGRKLEKCLKEFQKPYTNDPVFKTPSHPKIDVQPYKVENLSPTRLRIKKMSTHKGKDQPKVTRHSEIKVIHHGQPNFTKKLQTSVKGKSIKPLEFLHHLNTQPKPKRSSNPANVQKMLSFIKRSMKNRQHVDSSNSKVKECNVNKDASTPNIQSAGSITSDETNIIRPTMIEVEPSRPTSSRGMELLFRLSE